MIILFFVFDFVFYIYKCNGTGIIIPNKVKSVIIDNCNNCQIEVNDVITSLDIINCSKIKLFLKGIVQTINIDKTSEPNLFISQNTLNQNPKIQMILFFLNILLAYL